MKQTKAENIGLDQGVFNSICSLYDGQVCHQMMGFRITYLGKGYAGMKMFPNTELSTGGGRVHGGVIATILDAVMGAAAATLGAMYRTAEMKLNYLAPVFDETELIAEGRVIHPGNNLAVVEGQLLNSEGKLISKSLGTYFRDYKTPLQQP